MKESTAIVRRERAIRAERARQAVDGEVAEIEKMRAAIEGKYQESFKRYIDYQDVLLRLGTVETAQKQVVRLKALLSGRRSTNLLTIDRTLPDDDPVVQVKIIFEVVDAERARASREKQLKDSEKQHGATRRSK
ncbi:MAG TPA: hypothetical protein VGZ00_06465 [Candidatus Baltobacteraceae bacterium]|nr:hypothetical protein [Candidatus Baltobacteraceae bacterium]